MDPLTHAISGIALARALPRKPISWRQTAWLALLTMAPDIDILLRLDSDILYLQHHRGITHSLLLLPLWGWLLHAWLRRTAGLHAGWIAAALALHILFDVITAFGTMVWAPFSDWRAALDLVFIIDPLFTACLLLPLLAASLWRSYARLLGMLSLGLAVGYLLLAGWSHQQALAIARAQQPHAIRHAALPMPFSPFRWQLIAEYPACYQRRIIDLQPGFAGSAWLLPDAFVARYRAPTTAWQPFARPTLPADTPGLAFYRWFARFPFVWRHDAGTLELADLRFLNRGQAPPFRLHLDTRAGMTRAYFIWRESGKMRLIGSAAAAASDSTGSMANPPARLDHRPPCAQAAQSRVPRT